MKREGTIGAATFLAIAAVVGISLQTGPKQGESNRTDRSVQSKRSKPVVTKHATYKERPGCTSLQEGLEDFLAIENLRLPPQCYETESAPNDTTSQDLSKKTSQLKFVI